MNPWHAEVAGWFKVLGSRVLDCCVNLLGPHHAQRPGLAQNSFQPAGEGFFGNQHLSDLDKALLGLSTITETDDTAANAGQEG